MVKCEVQTLNRGLPKISGLRKSKKSFQDIICNERQDDIDDGIYVLSPKNCMFDLSSATYPSLFDLESTAVQLD